MARSVILPVIVLASLAGRDSLTQTNVKAREAVRIDEKGRKFVNKIPYDVFFENPLQVVNSHKNNVTTSKIPDPKVPGESTAPPLAKANRSHPGTIPWQELLPIEELQGELKTIRNSLTKSLANPGQYNQNFKSIAIEGAELAALAVIVQEHDDSLSWKDKAFYVREFGTQINQAATGLGKENFERTKSAFLRLSTALDGSIPADAGDVPEVRPMHEAAPRKGLMKRIEKAKDWLKQDVNSEAKFKSKSDQIRHEAAILSALATAITMAGYEYTDNDDYQMYAKSLIEGAKEASTATNDESFDKFRQAVDKVNKSCTDCHGAYGNG